VVYISLRVSHLSICLASLYISLCALYLCVCIISPCAFYCGSLTLYTYYNVLVDTTLVILCWASKLHQRKCWIHLSRPPLRPPPRARAAPPLLARACRCCIPDLQLEEFSSIDRLSLSRARACARARACGGAAPSEMIIYGMCLSFCLCVEHSAAAPSAGVIPAISVNDIYLCGWGRGCYYNIALRRHQTGTNDMVTTL